MVYYNFYRLFLNTEQEVYNTGFLDYLNNEDTIILVEWAEKILKFLPEVYFSVKIKSLTEKSREIKISLVNKN